MISSRMALGGGSSVGYVLLRHILHTQSVASLDGRLGNCPSWQRGSVVFASHRH